MSSTNGTPISPTRVHVSMLLPLRLRCNKGTGMATLFTMQYWTGVPQRGQALVYRELPTLPPMHVADVHECVDPAQAQPELDIYFKPLNLACMRVFSGVRLGSKFFFGVIADLNDRGWGVRGKIVWRPCGKIRYYDAEDLNLVSE